MVRVKLYAYEPGQDTEDGHSLTPAVLAPDGTLPRQTLLSTREADDWAQRLTLGHPEVCCWEVVIVQSDGCNGRVFTGSAGCAR